METVQEILLSSLCLCRKNPDDLYTKTAKVISYTHNIRSLERCRLADRTTMSVKIHKISTKQYNSGDHNVEYSFCMVAGKLPKINIILMNDGYNSINCFFIMKTFDDLW